jgi:hypothetical protein
MLEYDVLYGLATMCFLGGTDDFFFLDSNNYPFWVDLINLRYVIVTCLVSLSNLNVNFLSFSIFVMFIYCVFVYLILNLFLNNVSRPYRIENFKKIPVSVSYCIGVVSRIGA